MNLIAVLEGLLFVVGDEGISIEKLIRVLGISEVELQKIVDEYSKELNSNNRGLKLEKFNDNYKLVTKKEHAKYYKMLVDEEISDTLSPAALETLAIIAYNYWCDTPEKKSKFNKLLNNNQKIYEERLRNQYNPDNLFKNKKQISQNKDNSTALVEYKQSFFAKLYNKFKSLFRKSE